MKAFFLFLLVREVIGIEDFRNGLDLLAKRNVLMLVLCLANCLNFRRDPLVIMILADLDCSTNSIVVVAEEYSANHYSMIEDLLFVCLLDLILVFCLTVPAVVLVMVFQ